MRKKVVVLRQVDYDFPSVKKTLQNILALIYDMNLIKNKIILIKPNCGAIATPKDGLTVHPIVLKALIQILKENKSKEIIVAESSYVENDTIEALNKSGLMRVIEEEKINFIDFKKSEYIDIKIDGLTLKQLKLPKILINIDLLISLAKLKTNLATTVTLSIKNLKGLIPDAFKRKFHLLNLANSIFDLYKSITIEKIGIIDGVIGSELYSAKKGNILAGSNDLVSLDLHCSKLMGFKKQNVKYLNLFETRKYKIITNIKSISKFNKKPSSLEEIEKKYNVNIIGRAMCSSCLGFLINGLKKAKNENLLKNKITTVIGPQKDLQSSISDEYIIIGNCLKHLESKGLFISGCPPISSDLVETIKKLKLLQITKN
ncbi:MAG: DUF362 domain-containing protein [Promethearchaeota archaeon]